MSTSRVSFDYSGFKSLTSESAKKRNGWTVFITLGVVVILAVLCVVGLALGARRNRNDGETDQEPLPEEFIPIEALVDITADGQPCGSAANTNCLGFIRLVQETEDTIVITYNISGLNPNQQHAFHVHEKADFRNGCASTGLHYNPMGHNHGSPTSSMRHVGDLGNIQANAQGIATGRIVDNMIKLFGETSVVGLPFVVHAGTDDLGTGGNDASLITGNAGGRIACGASVALPIRAVVTISTNGQPCGASNSAVCGFVTVTQETFDESLITYEIDGLPPGLHGFHIHERADFSNGCASTGLHYNPFGQTHGGPTSAVRHVGDLGNIEADDQGFARGRLRSDLIKLFGATSVLGLPFVVHANEDDLGTGEHDLSPVTGNAGGRIACGASVALPIRALANISPNGQPCNNSSPCGVVTVTQETPQWSVITYDISGLPVGLRGFHVHDKADFSNGCVSTGMHYNPFGQTHGGPTSAVRHVGDLGNIEANTQGVARGLIRSDLIKLFGATSVVGLPFVVHAGTDDLGTGGDAGSSTTGNAGGRIACGSIN